MDIVGQQAVKILACAKRFFRLLSLGDIPRDGHVEFLAVDGQTKGADFDRQE